MSDPTVAVLMLGLFIVTILLGFPIWVTLMGMAIFFGYYAYYDVDRMQSLFDNRIFDLLVNQTYSVMANDVLVAVPLFLFMGYIVERANLVDRLVLHAADRRPALARLDGDRRAGDLRAVRHRLGHHRRGGDADGASRLPGHAQGALRHQLFGRRDLRRRLPGHPDPPSIMLIVYAAAASMSVVRLYAGAIIPGFMLAGLYMIYVIGRAWLNPKLAPPPKQKDIDAVRKGNIIIMMMTSFFPLAFLILSVLGAILFGLATPTEAASMGAAGGIVLAAGYRIASIRAGDITPNG